ncbi:MAG: FtsX-like permease family protein [Pseudomonadota bacterium]
MTADVARFVALRYLRRGRHQYARFIGWVSLVGIALGVAMLVLVLSVMNGFNRELTTRILGTVPHVLVEGAEAAEVEAAAPDALASLPFFLAEGLVTREGAVFPVAVYGLEGQSAERIESLAAAVSAPLPDLLGTERAVVLGAPLARLLGLLPGDAVMLMLSRLEGGRVRPRLERFRLTGTFEIGAELDYGLALVRLADVREARFAGTGRFGVRVVLDDPYGAPGVAAALAEALPEARVSDWSDDYGELFRAVRLEKAMMFVLLVLIVGIAAFNVVAGQTMLVNDKRGDIGILRTMGAEDATVVRVFLLQGVITATLGVLLGVALGLLLAWNITDIMLLVEQTLGFRVLDGTYFLEVPSQVRPLDVLAVALLALFISTLAAYLPAAAALKVNPVEALHQA